MVVNAGDGVGRRCDRAHHRADGSPPRNLLHARHARGFVIVVYIEKPGVVVALLATLRPRSSGEVLPIEYGPHGQVRLLRQ